MREVTSRCGCLHYATWCKASPLLTTNGILVPVITARLRLINRYSCENMVFAGFWRHPMWRDFFLLQLLLPSHCRCRGLLLHLSGLLLHLIRVIVALIRVIVASDQGYCCIWSGLLLHLSGLLLHLIRVIVASDHTPWHIHTHLAGLLWTRDRGVADTSTWRNTNTHMYAPPGGGDSNPQS